MVKIRNKILSFDNAHDLIEHDPGKHQGAVCEISLVFDWANASIDVTTDTSTWQRMTAYRYNGREDWFELPSNVDATLLGAWVELTLIPKVQKFFDAYADKWEGSNYVADWTRLDGMDSPNEYHDISDIVEDCPAHDMAIWDASEFFSEMALSEFGTREDINAKTLKGLIDYDIFLLDIDNAVDFLREKWDERETEEVAS